MRHKCDSMPAVCCVRSTLTGSIRAQLEKVEHLEN